MEFNLKLVMRRYLTNIHIYNDTMVTLEKMDTLLLCEY